MRRFSQTQDQLTLGCGVAPATRVHHAALPGKPGGAAVFGPCLDCRGTGNWLGRLCISCGGVGRLTGYCVNTQPEAAGGGRLDQDTLQP